MIPAKVQGVLNRFRKKKKYSCKDDLRKLQLNMEN